MSPRINEGIIITGAANGIGKAIANLFAKKRINLLLVDNDKKVFDVAKKLDVYALCLDVSTELSWIQVKDFIVNKKINLRCLINNAGICGVEFNQNPENISLTALNTIINTNFYSVVLGCKYGIDMMKNNSISSNIVNISSRSALVGVPEFASYAASKASVSNYTKSAALYCAKQNYKIRINSVAPAAIYTNMWNHSIKNKRDKDNFAQSIPLKRMGNPKDVAYAVQYLASQKSDYVTGAEMLVDGGILAGSAASP